MIRKCTSAKSHYSILTNLQIKPRVNLPVGQNLQDHIFAVVGPFLLNQTVSYILDRDTNLKTLVDYFGSGTGKCKVQSGIRANHIKLRRVVNCFISVNIVLFRSYCLHIGHRRSWIFFQFFVNQ